MYLHVYTSSDHSHGNIDITQEMVKVAYIQIYSYPMPPQAVWNLSRSPSSSRDKSHTSLTNMA